MIKRLARFIRGQRPTLLEADKANEIVDFLNNLLNIQVVEGEETKANIHANGITISVRVPKIEIPKPVEIKCAYPLRSKLMEDGTYQLWIEGYTRFIKYCGGDGNLLHIAEPYNSVDILVKDMEEAEEAQNSSSLPATGISATPASNVDPIGIGYSGDYETQDPDPDPVDPIGIGYSGNYQTQNNNS